ncbi:formyltransferase family protein [Kamptonema sp. UHCC 0994]|uniref:formyltransferase family protein n=1 Tax=Kamptonema sp. UHCC 0994 TaxID=3031329 RepID=UPI0023B9D65C|nr:formyltransferase family protein [Kamptonema sp. UHCC 0994]MDF0551647.1 formyltransferase family protein [Kamptonema sp. UHCC 0994]
MKLNFVYFNLQEHPRGNYMLSCLIDAGYIPSAIIEEKSALAVDGKASLMAELNKISSEVPLPLSLKELVGEYDIKCYHVANHNDEECVSILKEINPDLIVLGDTRILKPYMLDIPNLGIINVHPGYLPDVKGNNPYIWAIIHDLPQGCTVHFIDQGVDTGPIIERRKLFLKRGKSYQHLSAELNVLCGELLVEALHRVARGTIQGLRQSEIAREIPEMGTFRLAPPEIKALAIEKLNQGTYVHLS